MPKEKASQETYKIVNIKKSPAPRGLTGDDWHHYVIGRGNSIIEGDKVGNLKEVTAHAKDLAERINARNDKYGITYVSTYSPRKKG